MLYIGDIHGKYDSYKKIIEDNKATESIQVGDFIVGYPGFVSSTPFNVNCLFKEIEGNHRFIRGNHDNPHACPKCYNYIKDGTIENNTMYIGGALSIDKMDRKEGVDWWREEELTYDECTKLIDLYEKEKPSIMVTHECPEFMCENLKPGNYYKLKSITRNMFQQMYEIHKPDLWVFGHWHLSYKGNHDGCEFICLDILEYVNI